MEQPVAQTVTAFLFIKGTASTLIEHLVAQAQCAVAMDTLEKLRLIPEVGEIIVATPSDEFAARAVAVGARVETDRVGEDFHWGRCLAELVQKYRAAAPLYIGGGSGGLMSTEDWRAIVERVANDSDLIVANNYYSADFAAWSPGDALNKIESPALDNDLAYRLGERAKLRVVALPKNAATQLDIDTPTDLLTISFHPAVGKHLRKFLDEAHMDRTRVGQVRSLLKNRAANLLIAGRVSASMALFLERSTPCQWRIFSEERGMRASGRDQRGEVQSLLGFHLDQVGAKGLFDALARLSDATILDSRVLFAHRQIQPSAPDRFHSDWLDVESIENPWLREFTQAARDVTIPILLGGHSLVSGGMYALVES
jgi:hypothetical protein